MSQVNESAWVEDDGGALARARLLFIAWEAQARIGSSARAPGLRGSTGTWRALRILPLHLLPS